MATGMFYFPAYFTSFQPFSGIFFQRQDITITAGHSLG